MDCYYGTECTLYGCLFVHPRGRTPPCPYGEECKVTSFYYYNGVPVDHSAAYLHPVKKVVDCKFKSKCKFYTCKFNHPSNRLPLCLEGFDCKFSDKAKVLERETIIHFLSTLHPKNMVCKFGRACTSIDCTRLHVPLLCKYGLICNLIKNTNHLTQWYHRDHWLVNERRQCSYGLNCIYYLCRHNATKIVAAQVLEHCREYYH